MALFSFIKRKEEKKAMSCCCSCKNEKTQAEEDKVKCCSEKSNVCCDVKVLGAGCKSCHTQYENVKKAIDNMGLNAQVEYITDLEKITAYGVMSMPAIVVNDKVVSMGKVLKIEDVEKLFRGMGY